LYPRQINIKDNGDEQSIPMPLTGESPARLLLVAPECGSQERKTLYFCLSQPYGNFFSIFWGCTNTKNVLNMANK
jgi:hypothetical protein